jgi:hypothetical protein
MQEWTTGKRKAGAGRSQTAAQLTELVLFSFLFIYRMLKDDRVRYDPRKDWSSRDTAAQESERIDEGGTVGALDRQREAMTTRRNQNGEMLLDINDDELDWS